MNVPDKFFCGDAGDKSRWYHGASVFILLYRMRAFFIEKN